TSILPTAPILRPSVSAKPAAVQTCGGCTDLLIWGRLKAHRSLLTQQFIRDQRGRFAMEYLPTYGPELNPVEISGRTASTTNCPMSAPRISGIWAKVLATP